MVANHSHHLYAQRLLCVLSERRGTLIEILVSL